MYHCRKINIRKFVMSELNRMKSSSLTVIICIQSEIINSLTPINKKERGYRWEYGVEKLEEYFDNKNFNVYILLLVY